MMERRRRPQRGSRAFLEVEEVPVLVDAAWDLADGAAEVRAPQTFENALKVEVAVFTGLRSAELHALTPRDVGWETGLVRVGMAAKGARPRWTTFINGRGESPTLAKLRDYLVARGRLTLDDAGRVLRADARPIWRSGEAAWWHWVTHRLGPASGLQREVPALTGRGLKRLWRVHPHALRAAWVMLCRRLPPLYGRKPLSWEAICLLGGWSSSDVVQRYYYDADLPNALGEVDEALSPAFAGP